jgi:signal transduction histidine kinase
LPREHTLLEALVPANRLRLSVRIIVGLTLGVVSVLLRFVAFPEIGARFGMVAYMPAIGLSAWIGGLVSGVLSTVMACSFAAYYLLGPTGSLNHVDIMGLMVLGMTGILFAVLNEVVAISRVRAGEAVRARDEFLSIAGHELRTPLTELQLQVQNLRRQRTVLDAAAFELRLERADRYVARLHGLVEELLDVSRFNAGRFKLTRESFDIAEVLREVVEREADHLQRAGCTVELTTVSAAGDWDRPRVDQVITNLLSNAWKYGKGKPVRVSLEADELQVRLQVRDEGIGIPETEQARIFERFERAVSTRNYGGLGLGLWIVREIVEAHGGQVRVFSSPGNGSTFVVELPRRPPEA